MKNLHLRSVIPILLVLAFMPASETLCHGIAFSQAGGAAAATSACTSSTPGSGSFTATLCLASPSSGATLIGNTTVSATLTVSGISPGVQRLVFFIDGAYLLTDYQSTYKFTLPTKRWKDGSHSLAAEALMRNGFLTRRTTVSVKFKNGVTIAPVNHKQFKPTSGRTPAPGAPFIVAAAGDGASGEVYAGKVADLVKSVDPNLFLYLGDVYERGSRAEFYNWYGTSTTLLGRLRSITDPTVGNHEYLTRGAAGYFDYWDNIPNYYSFNAGGWHFISLNSNTPNISARAGSPQYQWLNRNLASVPASQCTIVYYHQPLYNIGSEAPAAGMTDAWKLMAHYGVDIVLNGHDHDYQRWRPLNGSGQRSSNGITEFVVGTAGHGLQEFTRSDTRVAYSNNQWPSAFGILLLQLNKTGASFSYRNTNGTVLDSGTVPCVRPTADLTAPGTRGAFAAGGNLDQ